MDENDEDEGTSLLGQRARYQATMDRTKILLFNPLLGTVHSNEQLRLKKLLFRVSRGKAYVQFFPL